MKNAKDFRKINQGKYGAINLNNMIPVVDNALIPLDFSTIQDQQYKNLLQNQYRWIKSDFANIKRIAKELYVILTKDDSLLTAYEKKIKARYCNITLLEQKCDE